MTKVQKVVCGLLVGALAGAFGLSLLTEVLLIRLDPQRANPDMAYSMLFFGVTVPVGSMIGGMMGFSIFDEGPR